MAKHGDDGAMQLADIAFDCSDPQRTAAFWSVLLGIDIAGARGPYVVLKRPHHGPRLVFQKVDYPTPGKNRLHLDLQVSDLAAAVARVEELGGTRCPEFDAGGFLVMADPEDNVFCLLPTDGDVGLDEAGIAHYR
jgi:predicted enzyme related to lactoylglutathione lyase